MDKKHIEKLEHMLCKELEEFAEIGKLKSPGDLDIIWKLIDALKDLDKIKMLEGEDSGKSYGMSYDGGYSERKYQRRDSMGRYSSDGEEGSELRLYSRDGAKDHMMSRLGEMMENASPNEREILKDAMRRLEKS